MCETHPSLRTKELINKSTFFVCYLTKVNIQQQSILYEVLRVEVMRDQALIQEFTF